MGRKEEADMMMKTHARAGVVFFCLVILVFISLPSPAGAGDKETLEKLWKDNYGNIALPEPAVYSLELLAKAQPDECFYGIGASGNLPSFYTNYLGYPIYPKDLSPAQITACNNGGGHPKVNQAYVWGLAKWGDNLWFGTVANLLCQVIQAVGSSGGSPPAPTINSSWVCEMGKNGNVDTRPPRIFMYNTKTKTLTDKTQAVLDSADANLLKATAGLRSAGAHKGVVFLGGLTYTGKLTVTIFAFDGESGEYLGAKNYPGYSNIRQWRVINKELYSGVGVGGGGLGGADSGEILRWIGSLSDPFQFEAVGVLPAGDPAYLAEHKNRIFVSTWGGPANAGGMALYMSPAFGSDQKLKASDKDGWTVVWKLSDYELEPSAYSFGGALGLLRGVSALGHHDGPGDRPVPILTDLWRANGYARHCGGLPGDLSADPHLPRQGLRHEEAADRAALRSEPPAEIRSRCKGMDDRPQRDGPGSQVWACGDQQLLQ